MSHEIENVLTALDGFRMSDQMDYAAYSQLHDMISVLDVPGWISVRDRLPEKTDRYMCLCYDFVTKSHWNELLWHENNRWWKNLAYHEHDYTKHVVYWMPLPEPPKEERT